MGGLALAAASRFRVHRYLARPASLRDAGASLCATTSLSPECETTPAPMFYYVYQLRSITNWSLPRHSAAKPGSFTWNTGSSTPHTCLKKKHQRIERLLLRRIGAVLIDHHRRQKPRCGFDPHHLTLPAGKHRIARRPSAIALFGPPRQSPPRTRGMHRRPHPFRQAPMIRPRLRTRTQPIQIPLDGRAPLLQLPALPSGGRPASARYRQPSPTAKPPPSPHHLNQHLSIPGRIHDHPTSEMDCRH